MTRSVAAACCLLAIASIAEAGAYRVKDIRPGTGDLIFATELATVGSTLFFAADSTQPKALWKTDGTAEGTVLVKAGFSELKNFTGVDGTLFFSVNQELWKSDGTPDGTVLVASTGWSPRYFTAVGGTLFFATPTTTAGEELWKSDGTAAGTRMVKDIWPGPHGSYLFPPLVGLGGLLIFSADDGTHGRELWRSDGTEAGTTMIKDIVPGPGGSGPVYLTPGNGVVYFGAWEPTAGLEPWRTDGTPENTVRLADVCPGSCNSFPSVGTNYDPVRPLLTIANTLFFAAYHPNWRVPGSAVCLPSTPGMSRHF